MSAGASPRDAAAPRDDPTSIRVLVASNAITLLVAWWQRWPLVLLLWPYWIQSVIIGWYSIRRILALERFTTEGFKINGRQPPVTRGTKRMTAGFFAVHYGLFHLFYLVFLGVFTGAAPDDAAAGHARPETRDLYYAWAMGALFFITHRTSFRRNLASDRSGCPNIGTMMFLPYARVFPMHIMIVLGMALGGGVHALLLFGALKTLADVIMHMVEHRVLARPADKSRKSRRAPDAGDGAQEKGPD